MMKSEVLIVGAGPSGLATAIELGTRLGSGFTLLVLELSYATGRRREP